MNILSQQAIFFSPSMINSSMQYWTLAFSLSNGPLAVSIQFIKKKKGERDNVKNYRPITILSCRGKLFTSILNSRLNDYLAESMLLSENQAAFRKQYSTLDHIYSLYALNELQKSKKLKLYCCFIDFFRCL